MQGCGLEQRSPATGGTRVPGQGQQARHGDTGQVGQQGSAGVGRRARVWVEQVQGQWWDEVGWRQQAMAGTSHLTILLTLQCQLAWQ